ncbi:hypothetical protein STENM223S_05986 [Streptomyces tendae]
MGLFSATFVPVTGGAATLTDFVSMPALPRPSSAWRYTFHTPSFSGARTAKVPSPVDRQEASSEALVTVGVVAAEEDLAGDRDPPYREPRARPRGR